VNIENFKRRLTAILSADVEGYSRLMRDDEDETIRTITTYRTAIAKLVEQYRGRVVDSPGDNILSEFGSSVDAVNCAVEVQRELAERNAELSENRRMQFRIGVNSGDVVEEGARIYGDGVNIASRIEGLAEGGGICISGTVYDSIEGKLGLEFENLGKHEVKNIDKPIRVYRVLSYPGAAAHRVVKAKRAVGKTWRNVVVAIAAVMILGGGALAIWHFYLRPPPVEVVTEEEMAFPLPDKPSIAVLPFVNVSGNPEQDYIADGITEQIIATLARNPLLFIIASNSTFTYKGKPVKVQQVSRELGVRYVLEGSVQRSGDRVRITAQLIDATTGKHMWAKTYDRELKDIFALQDDITMKILTAIGEKLLGMQTQIKGTNNADAYFKWLKAVSMTGKNETNNRLARQMLEEVISLDPEFAWAYTDLGFTYYLGAQNGWSNSPGKDLRKAFELAQKSIELDQSLAHPHRLLGWIYFVKGNHEKAIAEAERAVALAPNNLFAIGALGNFLAWADRPEDAISVLKKVSRLSPMPTQWQLVFLGNAYYIAGRYEEALAYFKQLQEMDPDNLWAYITPASIYGQLGREKEAHATAKKLLRVDPNFSLKHWKKTRAFCKNRETFDQWLDGLRKAGLSDKPSMVVPEIPAIAVLPFANISGEPKEDYLSDGITEQIISALSKTPKMLVIARNSVFTYKGKPVMVQQVSEELGVRYVLEGSVQKEGDRLRITAQLIDAKTGNHLWSERYDRDLKDLFALQDDITKSVIMALQVKLTQGQAALVGVGTDNLEAYIKVMKGQYHQWRYNKNDNEISVQLAKEAIELDPSYTSAYLLLAWNYYLEASFGWADTPWQSYEKAIELAKKAISLSGGQYAGAYMALANFYARTNQSEEALAAGKEGLSLDPANSTVNSLYGNMLYQLRKFREAIPFFKKAIRTDPKPPSWVLLQLGASYFEMRQFKEANQVLKEAIRIDPEPPSWGLALLGASYVRMDNFKEAIPFLKKAIRIAPEPPSWLTELLGTSYYRMGLSYYETDRFEEAITALKEAINLEPEPSILRLELLGAAYYKTEQIEEAIGVLKEAITLWPYLLYPHVCLAATYSLAGRMEEARAQAAEILKIDPQFSLENIDSYDHYNFIKSDKERFINALRKAGLK